VDAHSTSTSRVRWNCRRMVRTSSSDRPAVARSKSKPRRGAVLSIWKAPKEEGLFSLGAGGRKETDAGRTASERSDSSSPSPSSNPTAHCSQTTSSV
jgi:hypothetical protein